MNNKYFRIFLIICPIASALIFIIQRQWLASVWALIALGWIFMTLGWMDRCELIESQFHDYIKEKAK